MFSQRVWPAELFDIICTDSFIPEFWVTTYPTEAQSPASEQPHGLDAARQAGSKTGEGQLFGITGFACGEKAEAMGRMPDEELIQAALKQLDEMFGAVLFNLYSVISCVAEVDALLPGEGSGDSADHQLPSSAYVRGHVADWAKETHIGGAYSHPSLGAHLDDRQSLL